MTSSAEGVALEAIIAGNPEEAEEILEDFFPSELKQLIEHAEQLSELADSIMRKKGAR